MDIATRFHPRARAQNYLDREGNMMPEDSGGESESNLVRRKFQRTTTDPSSSTSTNDSTFRKPSLPASATRTQATGGLEHRPSLSQRRKSTLRENVRVPSGPRDFPGSPGKQRIGSVSSIAPATTEPSRPYLPQSANSESYLYNQQGGAASNTYASFMNRNTSNDNPMDSPATPARMAGGTSTFEFLPDVNFDDFQSSIKSYDPNSPLLSDFPSVDGGKILPSEDNFGLVSSNGGLRSSMRQPDGPGQQKSELGRAQSLRQRLAGGRQASSGRNAAAPPTQPAASSLSGRKQGSVPQASASPVPNPAATAANPSRKSVGPGLITNLMKGTNAPQQLPTSASDTALKPALARNSSLSKARRTTMQPTTSAGAELPRASTLTATTQSRQNKVKSLQPPPRDQSDPNTPSSTKSASKNRQSGAQTPSSSGNRRQSIASGRASGLGARTISPTDARRLKRMSMMQPPPMPTSLPKGTPPTPQDEVQNPLSSAMSSSERPPELPRLTQPSPSLIPRKANNATPVSARASPESRQGYQNGGVSLSTKSSYQSLVSNGTNNNSSSRLPTPKPRNAVNTTNLQSLSSSAMAQYGDMEDDNEEFIVPPVPAIPKAYESPKDLESHPPFFSNLTMTQSASTDSSLQDRVSNEVPSFPPPSRLVQTPRTSLDVPSETPRKRSGEHPRHIRTNTLTNGAAPAASVYAPTGQPKTAAGARAQPDPNGRKNANLQPLRLPPMNLQPFNTNGTSHKNSHSIGANAPRPSEELDNRDDENVFMSFATPEPKRNTKTPSTPMTASKATFFRRQEEKEKAIRSSSSHYALRDMMGYDDGSMLTKFWDDSDMESAGVPIPNAYAQGKQRNAITPFASGSLPKGSAEYARAGLRGRPSGEYDTDEYSFGGHGNIQLQESKPQGPRVRAQTTNHAMKPSNSEIDMSPLIDEPPAYPGVEVKKEEKKESAGAGLRRKLSLGWRRSSSKNANHPDNKSSPLQESGEGGKDGQRSRLHKKNGNGSVSQDIMPPPKLPASATWSGDIPSLPSSGRPSFDSNGHIRQRSQVPTMSASNGSLMNDANDPQSASLMSAKTRSLHSEQPMPVTSSAAARASSWGNLSNGFRGSGSSSKQPGINVRHKPTSSSVSGLGPKDKDDYAADEEMHRLSRKRKDVDTAARESEDLKKRAMARSPVSAEHVLHDRGLMGGSALNVFERGEVVDYDAQGIYFTGTKNARKVIGSMTPSPQPSTTSNTSNASSSSNNFGYDDERGDYNIVLGDHLAYRYEVVDVLGKGSFGQVVRCVDHRDGGVVAVKIIRNKKRFHQQALVEVGILGKLREWDPDGNHATLSITSSFYFRSHLCIVTPCLSINLYELIRAHNFTGFNLSLIRRFARQLLACLTLLQTKRIIHCDLKPENILLCEARKADVRVIDFGSSCREEEKVYTYIQSRFYRSPEVILGSSYGLGIDMWSLGCILAELWSGYPLFPGENEQEQLACIMEIFGPPDRHLVERCTRKKLFFDSVGKPRVTVSSKGRRRRPSSKTLQQALKTEDEAFVDFISRCLRWDPDRRMKPADAMNHPFITNQPLNQRPGIPDEARRAARVRSTAAVPIANGQPAIPSPVKRAATGTSAGNAFAAQQSTPARDRARQLPETPQTALRNGVPTSTAVQNLHQGSPVKASATGGGSRRHSTITTAGAAAVAGSKRASNGAVLAGAAAAQQRNGSGNLAQMAARESMGGPGVGNPTITQSGRWRS